MCNMARSHAICIAAIGVARLWEISIRLGRVMHSSRQASPTGGSKASPRKTVSWLLGLAFATILLSIASATWAPSAALGAGDQYISGTAVAPAALQAIKAPEFAPLRTPEKTNAATQQSSADKASSPLRLAANTSTLNLPKQYYKAVYAHAERSF